MVTKQYRQGDILITAVDSIPDGAKLLRRTKAGVVLAHGSATGHTHAIAAQSAQLRELDGRRYLSVPRGASLTHDEHDTIRLAPGLYEVTRQREWADEMVRGVED